MRTVAAPPPTPAAWAATQEIANSGPTFSPVLKSGIRNSGGYKCYLDLRADEAIDIAALLASATDSDSDDHDTLPTAPKTKNMTGPWGRPGNF